MYWTRAADCVKLRGMRDLPENLAQQLLPWYEKNRRDLPWRQNATPYRVWVSEIMLQQTRIETAKGYFSRFMEAFPDMKSLAAADEEAVLKVWEGLGYYSRARNLHEAAKRICMEYGGELPADFKSLRELPGVGDYTAGAIASIAFGLPEPAVDGNVLRVCARLTCCARDIGEPAVKMAFRRALRDLYPAGSCGAFTSALMELGETVCTPGLPACARCPLAGSCGACQKQEQDEFPVMPVKKARRIEARTVFLLEHGGCVALRKRPEVGLLAKLWEFPNTEGLLTAAQAIAQAISWGCDPRGIEPCGQAVHIFTHLEWHMTGWRIDCGEAPGRFEWTHNAGQYAIPAAFRAYKEEENIL